MKLNLIITVEYDLQYEYYSPLHSPLTSTKIILFGRQRYHTTLRKDISHKMRSKKTTILLVRSQLERSSNHWLDLE